MLAVANPSRCRRAVGVHPPDAAAPGFPVEVANCYSIKLPNKEAVTDILAGTGRLDAKVFDFIDPFTGITKKIRIQKDTDLATRNTTNAMSRLWDSTKEACIKAGMWSDEKFTRGDREVRVWRLLNTGGKLFIVKNGLPHFLFQAKVINKDQIVTKHDPATAAKFNIAEYAASVAPAL